MIVLSCKGQIGLKWEDYQFHGIWKRKFNKA